MKETRFRVPARGAGSVSLVRTEPDAPADLAVLYAPGAGSNLSDPFGVFLAAALARAGAACVRFQFPYMEAGRQRPDPTPVLEETWRALICWAAPASARLVVGGRSLGGRIASQVVAQGVPVAGLALFAYPLRPPDQTRVRDAHLGQIAVPTLFCSGTRDAFAAPGELETAAAKVPHSRVCSLEGADHSFNVLKSSGRTRQDVWEEATRCLLEFLSGLR